MTSNLHVFVGFCDIAPKLTPQEKLAAYDKTDSRSLLAAYKASFKPTSKVELTISCRNLLCTHIIRNTSDPYCVVSVKRPWQERYVEIARTETIHSTLNPQWFQKIILDYSFEAIQHIKFEILDKELKKEEFLGRFQTSLSVLVLSQGRQFVGKLVAKVNGEVYIDHSEIIIVTEEVSSCKQIFEIQFSAGNLPKRSWFRSHNPFLIISRSNEDGSYSVATRTNLVQSRQNATWKPISIRATALCNGDFNRSIKIDCYSHRSNGNHKLIGTCYTSLNELNSMFQDEQTMKLINEEKQKHDPSYVASGVLRKDKSSMAEEITFLDYIQNGSQMHFAVAIDFAASNGVQTDPKSLHYLSKDRMNYYEIALRGIGETLQHYDSDQLFPAFGFGAKLPSGKVSFQFPLNNNPSHPYCSGVEEILKHYRAQLKSVELSGPTNFAPVINDTIGIAKQFQDGKHYFVLLIVTNGIISDIQETKRAIIDASTLPISIIIVGVGDADFGAMTELDSDESRLSVGGRYAERDIVQFVPLKKFLSKNGSNIDEADLAGEVLAEIPEQFVSYMQSHGFKPQVASSLPPDSSVIDSPNGTHG